MEQLDHRGKPRVQTVNDDESMTVQSDGARADINKILREFKEVGILENLNAMQAEFADISDFVDYKDALGNAMQAEADFMTLPSKVREMFNHDVAEFLDTAHDPEKRDALVAAGIIDGPKKVGPEAGLDAGATPAEKTVEPNGEKTVVGGEPKAPE